MSEYFRYFNKRFYDVKMNGFDQEIVDITERFDFLKKIKDNAVLFKKYEIKDEERPDMVSYKFYKNSNYDWIILMVNDIFDPYYEWPLSNRILEEFIKDKYGSVETAQQTVKYYQWIIRERQRFSNGDEISEKILNVTQSQYNDLAESDRRILYAYDYEKNLNEEKRNIKIIDKSFIPQIVREFREIFTD